MMICWIIILCGIFAITEALPVFCEGSNQSAADGIVIIAAADEPAPDPVLSSDPWIKLPPDSCDSYALVRNPSRLLHVGESRNAMLPRRAYGQVHGRAPPAGSLA